MVLMAQLDLLSDRVSLKLAHIQVIVESVFIQQLLVCALFYNFPMVDHHDIIGIADGAQPVSNDKACTAFH